MSNEDKKKQTDQPDIEVIKISVIADIQAKFITQTKKKLKAIEADIQRLFALFNQHGRG